LLTLNTRIGEVAPFRRAVCEWIRYNLPPIPSALTSLMAQVGQRFVIQYANANRFYGFSYPQAMIGDTTAPQAAAPVVTMLGRGNVKISWTTNEFAQTRFRYGAQPGVYTQTLTDTLYYKLHEITLNGLIIGKTHTIGSAIPIAAISSRAEYRFVVNVSIYLPLVRSKSSSSNPTLLPLLRSNRVRRGASQPASFLCVPFMLQ
jgi:hypothetical protein